MNSKEKIIRSFISLAKARQTTDIAVKDICLSADVSRKTSYNHFSDRQNIVEEIFVNNIEQTIKNCLKYEMLTRQFLVTVYNAFLEEKDFFIIAINQSDIDEVLKRVCLIYENNKTLIQYQMEIQSENKSYAYDVEDEKTKKEQIVVDGNTIDIIQYELDAGKEEYVAQFVYNDVFYTINATMSEKEFKEFLKNLYFS